MAKKPEPFIYGKSPNPTTWHEGAAALMSIKKPGRKPSGLLDRLDRLEALLKEKQ